MPKWNVGMASRDGGLRVCGGDGGVKKGVGR